MKIWQRIICLALCTVLLLSGCGILNEPETTNEIVPGTSGTTENGGSTSVPGTTENAGDTSVPETTEKNEPDETIRYDPTVEVTQPPAGDDIIDIGFDKLPCTEEELYNQLFDLNNKIEVNIEMDDDELQKLQDDYEQYRNFNSKSPIYRMATVTITITAGSTRTAYRIHEVGVRMKGNTSRTDFYNDQDGIYKYIHLKLDFQETFDDWDYYGSDSKVWANEEQRKTRKDRTFATLEQLEMRWNKCYDPTYLKETYAYALYRSEDVLAPLTNLASFDWSGVHMGVYTINEPVDKVFLEKRLPASEADGDLYKCGWTNVGCTFTSLNSIGIENEDEGKFYCYDLKNNKKTSDHSALKNLITGLNSSTLTKDTLAELVDIDNFLSFAAVSYFLGNPDDIRNNYNNFYLYFLPSSGKALFIPYDYDRCLGVTYEYDPSGHGMTRDDPFADTAGSGGDQQSPLFLYTVAKGGFYVAEYAQVLERVAGNTMLKSETFETWFNRARALYGSDVAPSKTLRNAEGRKFDFSLSDGIGGNMSFNTYMTQKMATYSKCMAKLDSYLSYVRPVPSNYYIRGDFNGWSNHDEYGMTNEDGLMTFTLRFNHDFSFKVFDNVNQDWLGVECLPEDTAVAYTTNEHGNIQLKAGTYLVTYDPETMIITLTKL